MKKFMVYLALIFLVTLQLPKTWLHHHDHEHVSSLDDAQDIDCFDNEDCFACELTIDSFDGPLLPIRIQSNVVKQKVTKTFVESLSAFTDLPYNLRGPPAG